MFLFWLRARTGKPTAFQMMAAKILKLREYANSCSILIFIEKRCKVQVTL